VNLANATCRAILGFTAIAASFSLIVSYCVEAAAHKDVVPLAIAAPLWLLAIVCSFGFIVGSCAATVISTVTDNLIAHLDQLYRDMRAELRAESDYVIEALDGDDEDRRTIDNHLAAHLAATTSGDTGRGGGERTPAGAGAPTQRRGTRLGVVD
jgi:uncharacterized membrane protein YhiD involved in acid resistance